MHDLPGLRLSALPAAILLSLPGASQGIEFSHGELEGSFNSHLSIGASWSTEDADYTLVGGGNGGSGESTTTDDGRLNFKKGETFSETIKGVHDLSLSYRNYGLFVRGKYWYDRRLKDSTVQRGHLATGYSSSGVKLDDGQFDRLQKFSGAALLDAYVHSDFEIHNAPLEVRLGKQVVSWGESTFIQGGINSINPVDVNAFRRPGAEIKEGLLPVNMIYANLGMTDNLTLEAFYQLTWQATVFDGGGTFFAGSDIITDADYSLITVSGDTLSESQAIAMGAYVARSADATPDNDGQYGIAARIFSPALNETEFGLYYMKYHSRTPILSTNGAANAPTVLAGPTIIPDFASSSYFLEYPEAIELYGISFNTSYGAYSFSGEVSYRPNQPVQENSTNLLSKSLGLEGGTRYLNQTNTGYDRLPVTQAQLTVGRFLDRVLGAERMTLIGELGYTHTGNLNQKDKFYGRSPLFANATSDNHEGTYTSNAWGYRLSTSLSYSNVFSGINLTPNVAYAMDVEGYSSNATFVEDRQALSLGLTADYLGTYTANISFTSFWGGQYNTGKDRDFASVSVGVSF